MSWTPPSSWVVGQKPTAADFNAQIRDNANFLYGDPGWSGVTFQNGWTNYGGGWGFVSFRLVGTRVWLRGLMSSGTSGATAFTLPVGYRPQSGAQYICVANGGVGILSVNAGGTVVPTGSNVYFSVDGVSFDVLP